MADFTDVLSLSLPVPNKNEFSVDTELNLPFPTLNAFSISGSSPDTDPPLVSFSPSGSLGPFDPSQIITVEVEDAVDLDNSAGGIQLFAHYPALNVQEVIYNGSVFIGEYSGVMTIVSLPPDELVELVIQRTGGWYASPMQLIVQARDVTGNLSIETDVYEFDPDPTPDDPDPIPPVVSNFDPLPGSNVLENQSIKFDVTDNSGKFARIIAIAWFPETGLQEVIHDGDDFVGSYSLLSSRVIITDGYRFSVLRSGGWPSSPTIRVFPIDAAGNEP